MIGRGKELKELDILLTEHHRVAITDMRGLGKTTLAYQCGQGWIDRGYKTILVNSGTEESLIKSLRGLADELEIKNYRDKQPVAFVQNIWNLLENFTVLIIYDNVESLSEIGEYLPPENQMKLYTLITSQNQVHSNFKIFEMKTLVEKEACKLIKAKLNEKLWNSEEQSTDVKKLIKITEGLVTDALSHQLQV